MPQTAKFIVTGAPGAGKTSFVASITGSEIPDSGELTINENLTILLEAVPLDDWEQHIPGALGVILLVDGTQPQTFANVPQIVKALGSTPCIIAVNKQDLPDAQPPRVAQRLLPEDSEIKVFPCVATEKQSAENVLLALIYSVLR